MMTMLMVPFFVIVVMLMTVMVNVIEMVDDRDGDEDNEEAPAKRDSILANPHLVCGFGASCYRKQDGQDAQGHHLN